jgi:tetratricopeptide (TPR) repeat protein
MGPHKERKSDMHGIKEMGIAVIVMITVSVAFSAQDPSVLLEKAIYTEETLGNLSEAINLYKQVIDMADTNRNIGALALYRLGMCYRKTGRDTEALATFSKLAQLYPEQRDLITESLLPNLKPAPWADGEILRLAQKFKGGPESGLGVYSVESSQRDGKLTWDLRYFFGFTRSPQYYSVTQADFRTMLPITSRTVSNQTDLEARYSNQNVEVLDLKDSTQPPKLIPSTGNVYEAWQIGPLLRRLLLREGFQVTIPMFAAASGSFANVKFSVVARETITVPAGSFDCYKVVINNDANLPADQIFWISADSNAYLVKAYINATNMFELKSIEVVGKNQLLNVQEPEMGISLSVPRQWNPWRAGPRMLMLLAPEFESSLNAMVLELGSGNTNTSVSQMSGAGITISGRKIVTQVNNESHQIRTRENITLAGLTGERYIADGTDTMSGEPIVEYVYTLASQTKTYVFRFQTGRDNFDKMKPAFESILSSLKVQ